jgi:hypothetical protein
MVECSARTRIPSMILDNLDQIKPSCLRVMLAIARHDLGGSHDAKSMTIAELMTSTGLSNRSVITAAVELSDLGWIKRHRVKHERGETYEYELVLGAAGSPPLKRQAAASRPPRRTLRYRKHKSTVFRRDESTCVYCGSTENLTLDHIVPFLLGGSDDIENLACCCKSCNSSKGAKSLEKWRPR